MPKAIFIWGMHLRCEALDICYLECVPGGRFSDGLDRNEMPRTEEDGGGGGGGGGGRGGGGGAKSTSEL